MSQATASSTERRLSGREAAMARRQALSLYGKKGMATGNAPAAGSATAARLAARNENASPAPAASQAAPEAQAPSCGCQHAESTATRVEYARPSYTPEPISASRQRRIEQSQKGRGDAAPCRPCGRVRPEPQKVELGTTLAGSTVTGNQVERTSRVTGNEPGSCRTITGTEYIGAEQYGEFCGTLPEPSPAKVATTSTSRGRRVTGTEVGRSTKVTGDETGTCKRVTGTEYLAAEQAGEFCGTSPEPHPEKFSIGATARQNPISGTDLTRQVKVTGGESGAARSITGSAYADTSDFRRAQGDAPKKVQTRHTSAGSEVSGTLVGRSSKVTGDESGSCKRVTGSDYISAEEFVSFCRAEPHLPPAKVGVSRTLAGQDVSGTQVGRSGKVTGDEYGACKPVTGTSYIGADQYAAFCAERAAAEAISRARLGRSAELTGIQPGPDSKMTGNERGECQAVSGTPYVGEQQQAAACGGAPMATHIRARGPQGATPGAGITGNALDAPGVRQAGEFSVDHPAPVKENNVLTLARNYLYMTPELAGYLRAHALAKIQLSLAEFERFAPYWFVSKYDATSYEGVLQPLYDYPALFQARAWIVQEPFGELVKWLDVPAFERGLFSAEIQPRAGLTPFARLGNSLAIGLAWVMLGWALIRLLPMRRRP